MQVWNDVTGLRDLRVSKDKVANTDFPIRYNPFSSKQSPAKVCWEKWRRWKHKVDGGETEAVLVVVKTDKQTLHAGNHPHLQAQRFFQVTQSLSHLVSEYESFYICSYFQAHLLWYHYRRQTSCVL